MKTMTIRTRSARTFSAIVITGVLVACAATPDPYPATDSDGLKRVQSSNVDALYLADDVNLAQYSRIAITMPTVAMRDNWMRDQNSTRSFSADRVTEEDETRIKTAAADSLLDEFNKQFERTGYELTGNPGPDVLLVEPAIVDLDVRAPDTSRNSSTAVTTYTKSKGKVTLDIKFLDSVSGKVIGHVIDEKEDFDSGTFWLANSVSNRAEINRAMRGWAEDLTDALDAAKN